MVTSDIVKTIVKVFFAILISLLIMYSTLVYLVLSRINRYNGSKSEEYSSFVL